MDEAGRQEQQQVIAEIRTELARRLVHSYVIKNLEKTDTHVEFTLEMVYVVWFTSVLRNWKAMVSTQLADGMYYEVTHSGEKGETYIDAYKKWDNVCIPDAAPPLPQRPKQKDPTSHQSAFSNLNPAGPDRFA